MKKIATHNSATGEKSSILSLLVIPFSRTQSKTIEEQWDAGCRYFDIRVKKVKNKWVCAHGLWRSKLKADDILSKIDLRAHNSTEEVYVDLTYEGVLKTEEKLKEFELQADRWNALYQDIKFTSLAVKYDEKRKNPFKVDYKYIKVYNKCHYPIKTNFVKLDGRSWHTYLPLPRLWNYIYTREHKFTEDAYTFVDFL